MVEWLRYITSLSLPLFRSLFSLDRILALNTHKKKEKKTDENTKQCQSGFQNAMFCAYEEGSESQLNTSCSLPGLMLRVCSREQFFFSIEMSKTIMTKTESQVSCESYWKERVRKSYL